MHASMVGCLLGLGSAAPANDVWRRCDADALRNCQWNPDIDHLQRDGILDTASEYG
jgi:GH43 family beta-xylosidase